MCLGSGSDTDSGLDWLHDLQCLLWWFVFCFVGNFFCFKLELRSSWCINRWQVQPVFCRYNKFELKISGQSRDLGQQARVLWLALVANELLPVSATAFLSTVDRGLYQNEVQSKKCFQG